MFLVCFFCVVCVWVSVGEGGCESQSPVLLYKAQRITDLECQFPADTFLLVTMTDFQAKLLDTFPTRLYV